MGVMRVNLRSAELAERLDEAGFRHAATAVGERLGARRIGAGLYEAEAGFPIWPYHYHHGVEEWLYVIAGEPVLRDPTGERALSAGDLVRFPSGHLGAHTMKGPGRFVIFATGHHAEPYLSVYPDSDKISGPAGILLRSSAVDYWHGEGAGGVSRPAEPVREPESSPQQPVANVLGRLGPLPDPGMLGATVTDLRPGQASEPYHCTYGREEWLLVLAGMPTLRHPQGEDVLETGDVVCFAEGPDGAHALANRGEAAVRTLSLSTTDVPANVFEPDTGRWLIHNGPGAPLVLTGDA